MGQTGHKEEKFISMRSAGNPLVSSPGGAVSSKQSLKTGGEGQNRGRSPGWRGREGARHVLKGKH